MYVAASPRGEQLPPPARSYRELPSLAMADATGDTSKQLETSGSAPVSWTGCALDFAPRHVHVAARARCSAFNVNVAGLASGSREGYRTTA